jgi:hypothetical protein
MDVNEFCKKKFRMTAFTNLQHRWASFLSEPWKNLHVVGSAEVAQAELLKLLGQSVNIQADGRGGECISALLIGNSGVGKSYVIRTAIESLRLQGHQIIPITIHGSICTDDRSSMRQIFSQFQKYLLGGSSLDSVTRATFQQGSLSEWCYRLATLLQECARSDHMVIITLEDFDAFCHTKSKQSLLYNLFDLMHLKDTRFVVLGVTTRPDAPELLEKRIKSRFQLRKIVLSPPETFDDLIDIIEAVLVPASNDDIVAKPISKKGSKKNATAPPTLSVSERIRTILKSKELKQNWSLYKDMGLSVREFVTGCLSALVRCEDEWLLEEALTQCMHAQSQTCMGDVGIRSSIVPSLTLRDHIVLIALYKLHQDGKRPKCFAHILKEIGSFEKSNHMTTMCQHSNRAYWHSFQGLVRMGLIEMIDSSTGSSSLSPPPMFCRCRLIGSQAYANLFRDSKSLKADLSIIPNEVHQWVHRERNMHVE